VQKYQICELCVSIGRETVGSEGIRNSGKKGEEIGKGDVGAGNWQEGYERRRH